MRQVLDFLVGKKTYIMIGIDALDQLGILWGWWEEAKLREIIEAALTVGFLRAGLNTSAPAPIPFVSKGKLQSWVVLVLLIPFGLLATGCSTYIDRGNSRYERTVSTQEISWFGITNSFPEVQNCKGTQKEGYYYENLEWSECNVVRKGNNTHVPGLAHSALYVLGNVLSFGLLGLLAGGGDTNNNISQSQSQTQVQGQAIIVPGKGH